MHEYPQQGSRARPAQRASSGGCTAASTRASSACGRATAARSTGRWITGCWPGCCSSLFVVGSLALRLRGRRGLLPDGRFRPDAAARARPARHAHRGDRADLRRGRGRNPPRDSGPELIGHHRQHRAPERRHQPGLRRQRHHRPRRRRDPDLAQPGPEHGPPRITTRRLRTRLQAEVPRPDVLLPARQHHQPDPELRPARAHRRAGGRPQRRRRVTQIARQLAAAHQRRFPGAVDVHIHQVVDYPEFSVNVDRAQGQRGGADAARRRQQPADLAQLQRPGGAEPLAEPANGVNYQVAVQTPQYRVDSLRRPGHARPSRRSGRRPDARLLEQPGRPFSRRRLDRHCVSHYNVQPVFDVYANVRAARPGRRRRRCRADRPATSRPSCRRGRFIDVRGQVETMNTSFTRPRRWA